LRTVLREGGEGRGNEEGKEGGRVGGVVRLVATKVYAC